MKLWSSVFVLVLCLSAVRAEEAPPPPPMPAGPTAQGGAMPGGMMGDMGGGMMGCMGGGMMGGMAAPGGMGAGPMVGIPPLAGMLLMHRQMHNLTDQQVERLQAIQLGLQKEQIRRTADLQVAQLDLMQLLMQPNPDRAKVEAAVRDSGRQQTDLELAQARAYLDAWNVLTDAQRRQFLNMMGPGGMMTCPMCGRPMGAMGGMAPAGGAGPMGAEPMGAGAGEGGHH